MRLFKKKRSFKLEDPVQARFDTMLNLAKDLSQKDYKRLKKAMDAGYEAYQIVRNLESDDSSTVPEVAYELVKEREEK